MNGSKLTIAIKAAPESPPKSEPLLPDFVSFFFWGWEIHTHLAIRKAQFVH